MNKKLPKRYKFLIAALIVDVALFIFVGSFIADFGADLFHPFTHWNRDVWGLYKVILALPVAGYLVGGLFDLEEWSKK